MSGSRHENERSPLAPSYGSMRRRWQYALELNSSSGLEWSTDMREAGRENERQNIKYVMTGNHHFIPTIYLLYYKETCRVLPSSRLVRRNGPRWLVAKVKSNPSLVICLGKPVWFDFTIDYTYKCTHKYAQNKFLYFYTYEYFPLALCNL